MDARFNRVILIAGDSFSDASTACSCNAGSIGRHSWIDKLSEEFEIESVGQVGASNYDIAKQIKRSRNYRLLIVNLSHPHRTSTYLPHPRVKDEHALNLKIARSLAQRDSTICWTPFVGYESIPEVLYQPVAKHNEMYTPSVEQQCTNHHFNREGNDILYSWIKDRLNDKLLVN